MTHPFLQLDVFAPAPLRGNPLAVVDQADDLDAATLQSIACWLGLSETTFLLKPSAPEADYRVRIFTPGGELPFAGHPTLGSCAAWLQLGRKPRRDGVVIQQCGVGLVEVRVAAPDASGAKQLAFAAPPMREIPIEPTLLHNVAQALGLERDDIQRSAWLDNGPRWFCLWLRSAERVLAVEPDHAALKRLGVNVGMAGRHAAGGDAAIEVRFFGSALNVPEDPVTGSLNASLAQWLIGCGVLPSAYVAAQGAKLGRAGRVHIERDAAGQVWVGGAVQPLITGTLTL
ncbi:MULTISPECIES: PhzF family phenazine biosynthesis protein [unclassified Thiomonas]|uniref:PhzF family phenazine biosynthesis protein n=1 Tax=unclassified Thiomonas TaxID=2625466 RepID=UPI000AA3CC2C|nr:MULTISPECIES: PhzF family phenazine biosynthesis protein [unclassified Thiomonas]MDD4999800.1 PhzF family phenazine biosynthesis protein [Thiomonas arsenitoxydans]VDY04685.1 Phenazine biosynthesis protein PhzF family [Thiomonas sp. Bio17B3]VDY08142.1 Phenazine biosynthesis protein PhzF family [Thiomonas sp. Sup16B3]VDY12938.1 Phenazine biosynthesis protein, PhzF family [Thiomonas sp. OC7]VDY17854.1 Phenazine biosynthesis protein PhzF family [Thiomonas sp. CB2]